MTSTSRAAADASAEDAYAPSNKRPRLLSKACEACKVKKSRCDSSRPQCDPCRRKGLECIYREKGQPGLRPGYGKSMEHRMNLLENDVEKIGQSVQDILSHLRNGYAPNTSLATGSPEQPPPEAPEEVQLWQSSQPLLEAASFTSTPALEQLHSTQGIAPTTDFDDGLPPEPILRELVSLFFELVYPWVPLFYRPNFTTNMFSPDRRILLHGMVVIAFRFWKKPAPSPEMREVYIKASRNQILLGTIDVCSLTSTQALALLAVDAIGQGLGPRTWNIMAMLIAAAQQLSLAKSHSPAAVEPTTPLVNNEDPDDELCMSSVETEEKRRLFWVIYSLDRFSSIPHGQSGGINTKAIKLPYPSNDEDWGQAGAPEWFQATETKSLHAQHPTNLWHHNIDLLALLDRSNQLLIQPVNLSLPAHCQEWQSSFRRLDITRSTWFENLPREVRDPPTIFNPMWTMVHATFHLISIRMYTVAAFPSTTSPYLKPSSSARGRCRQAIRDVASLASPLQPYELDQLGPIFAFVVWVAARSLIIIWTTGYENTYGSLPTDLEPLLNALRQMGTHWPCAQRYADTIQLILDTKNTPGGPMGLDIFNDTRRTAYGLQNRLGTLAGPRATDLYSHSFDFLDMPILDLGDLTAPRVGFGTFPSELDGEWL